MSGAGQVFTRALGVFAALSLAACQPGNSAESSGAGASAARVPDPDSTEPYDGIAESELLKFAGTEPFWGGEVSGNSLKYTTLENQDGTIIPVERFAGRGGISFTGKLDGADFEMMVTPLECNDGMSDRTYPFTATLKVGDESRSGCGWSDEHPFDGPEQP